ncbi:MAG: YncE family protein [Myxococcales bacterium]|nr:YncE family protein [Myxococcales bacterium]
MKRTTMSVALGLAALGVAACSGDSESSPTMPVRARIFVANEDSGSISVIEEGTDQVLAVVALPDMYMPHNVQAAPDGKSIWVAAPPMVDGDVERAFVIDPVSYAIVASIELGSALHVAHVVLDPTSSRAYVTANEGNAVIEVDAVHMTVLQTIDLGIDRGPHGARWCGDRLYVANMTAQSLGIVDPQSGSVDEVALGGVAVQTACTPDGKYVFASLYDTKEVVRYALDTGVLARVALPAGAQGPVQIYPSPDSRTLWVCDQGVLMGRPASNKLYKLDVAGAAITGEVAVGTAAHGVVVSDDGALAYVTNLEDGTVSVVDTAAMTTVATVPVGTRPNGVTHLHATGGMP